MENIKNTAPKAEEFKLELDNTTMNVIRFGSGPKQLVIISGVTVTGLEGQGEGVAQAYGMFGEKYTVTLLERKKVLPHGWKVEDMEEDIFRTLCQLGIDRACVYGVSQGGMIALVLAARHPELVEKLALCSSQWTATEIIKEVAGNWVRLAETEDIVSLNRDFFKTVYSPAFLDSVRDMLPVLERQGTPEDCRRLKVLAQACIDFRGIPQGTEILCPTLVLGGTADGVIGVEGSREIAAHLGCPMVLYEGSSHAVYDENPEVKNELLRFFEG